MLEVGADKGAEDVAGGKEGVDVRGEEGGGEEGVCVVGVVGVVSVGVVGGRGGASVFVVVGRRHVGSLLGGVLGIQRRRGLIDRWPGLMV